MPEMHKTWMQFKQFYRTSHRELREKSYLIVEDAGMHHSNMVRDVVVGLQEALQQYQDQTDTLTIVQGPVDHIFNAMQNTQQQLDTHLHKMQLMMQTMQMHYNAVPHGTRQDYGGLQDYGGRGYHGNQLSYRGRGERGAKNNRNWCRGCGGRANINLTITVGNT